MTKAEPIEILIAEDDSLITQLQKRQLENLVDVPLKTFWNGKELMDYLANTTEEPIAFLIFLDINMPVMDGWEVLEKINKLYPKKEIFVVMLTSSLYPPDKEKALTYPQVIHFNDKFLDKDDFRKILNLKALQPFSFEESKNV